MYSSLLNNIREIFYLIIDTQTTPPHLPVTHPSSLFYQWSLTKREERFSNSLESTWLEPVFSLLTFVSTDTQTNSRLSKVITDSSIRFKLDSVGDERSKTTSRDPLEPLCNDGNVMAPQTITLDLDLSPRDLNLERKQ